MSVTLINLTPHDCTIFQPNGKKVIFPSQGELRLIGKAGEPLTPLYVGNDEEDGSPILIDVESPMQYVDIGPKELIPTVPASIIVSKMAAEWMIAQGDRFAHLTIYHPNSDPTRVIRDKKTGIVLGTQKIVRI